LYPVFASFYKNKYWNQGKAEFQIYRGRLSKYGQKRLARGRLILVKEPFDKKKLVKSLKSEFYVLKFNWQQIIPTGMYEYYQSANYYFCTDGRLLKISVGSQDGCGNTYIQGTRQGDHFLLKYFSYFDEQGYIEKKIPADVTFYGSLPVVLRHRLADKPSYYLKLVPSLIKNKFINFEIKRVKVVQKKVRRLKVGGRWWRTVHKVTVVGDEFYFAQDFPYRLLEWKCSNGDKLSLTKSYFNK
jgi:hypothetical protein